MKRTYFHYKCRNCGQIERRSSDHKQGNAIAALHGIAIDCYLPGDVARAVLHECDKYGYGEDARGIADLVGVCFE